MDLQTILNDKKTFDDNIEMPIGAQKVTLGQLREMSAKQQRDLSEKISGADRREAEARDTAMKAATLLAELEKARETVVAARSTPNTDEFEKDEFWGPVRSRFTERDKKLETLQQTVEALTNSVKQAASIWAEDRFQSQFEKFAPRLKKVDQFKEWTYEKTRDYAAQNKILDSYGMPSIEKAVMELTKSSDIEDVRKKAYEDGLKEGRTKARLDSMPRPSSASGGRQPKGKSGVEEMGLEALGDDVMNDAELMEQIAELGNIQ